MRLIQRLATTVSSQNNYGTIELRAGRAEAAGFRAAAKRKGYL